MKHELRPVPLVLCLGSLGFAVCLPTRADEPVYQERTLSSWLQDFAIGRFPDMEKDRAAARAIRAIGPAALPVLIDRLKNTTASDQDLEQDIYTIAAFEALGAEARPAIPVLIELLAPAYDAARMSSSEPEGELNGRKSEAASEALKAIGKESVPSLIKALGSDDVKIRFGAAMALESFGKQAADVVPALIAALEDQDRSVRWRAARSLGSLRAMPEVSVPALAKRVRDDSASNVRAYAIMALGKFGAAAESSLPDLQQATSSTVVISWLFHAVRGSQYGRSGAG